jgi:hypothetical protein
MLIKKCIDSVRKFHDKIEHIQNTFRVTKNNFRSRQQLLLAFFGRELKAMTEYYKNRHEHNMM